MAHTLEVIYKRIPAEPGQRRKPSDIIAVMPYELASHGMVSIIAASFYHEPYGWSGLEISLPRFHQCKPVAEVDVPPSLREYLERNPDGEPFGLKVRKRINWDRLRSEAWKR